MIEGGRLDPTPFATHLDPTPPFATHHFALGDTEQAYDVFSTAAETHALKVVLTAVRVDHQLVASAGQLIAVASAIGYGTNRMRVERVEPERVLAWRL